MNSDWQTVLSTNEVPLNGYCVVELDTISLLICHHQGNYYAVENQCSHDGTELEGGCLEGKEIICPRHGAGFCIATGEVTRPPAYEAIKTFPVRIEQGSIQVQLSQNIG